MAENWLKTTNAAFAKIVDLGGFCWQMLQLPDGSNNVPRIKARPADFFRRECAANSTSQTSPTMLLFSDQAHGPNASAPAFEVDLAAFLLIRTKFAWLGYSWGGCNRVYERPAGLDVDYGTPVDARCSETTPGIFKREWTKAVVRLDTNTNTAHFAMK
jgi:hypothetical protein